MKSSVFLLIGLLLAACEEISYTPQQSASLIVAHVHWETQNLAGIPIELVQTGDTVRTDASGLAIFSVPPGHYVVRAFGINRGGPVLRYVDFDVDVRKDDTAIVDIVDCLPCV